jgi:hypothetical protein
MEKIENSELVNSRREVLKKIGKTSAFVLPVLLTFNVNELKANGPNVSGCVIDPQQIENTYNSFWDIWKNKKFLGYKKNFWDKDKNNWYVKYLDWSKNNKFKP